jgi:hypothetical protein
MEDAGQVLLRIVDLGRKLMSRPARYQFNSCQTIPDIKNRAKVVNNPTQLDESTKVDSFLSHLGVIKVA